MTNSTLSLSLCQDSNNKYLQQIVHDIYENSTESIKSDLHLLSQNREDHFQDYVKNQCNKLPEKLAQRLRDELFGWGPITPLLGRDDIYDIMIQGPEHIYYESSEGVFSLNDCFLSEASFRNFYESILRDGKLLINQKDPFGNGKVLDFRVHVVRPPISQDICITLRKQSHKVISMDRLLSTGFLNDEERSIIEKIVEEKKSFLIVGPTGSGKTTFLNSLISTLQERLVIVEDTDEVVCPSPLSCKLLSRELCPENLKPIDLGQLVKQSLRMRPDRLVIGEVRGGEAKDLLQALATGHKGSVGTLHAESAQQALIRLEMLVQMGAPQWSLHSIRQLIQLSLDYLVVLRGERQNKGVKEIKRITSHERFGLLTEDVVLKQTQSARTTQALPRA